jgi:ABC-type uncharacterized transport system ATPase subunit
MINQGEIVIDQPMAKLKYHYLQEKIIDVRLENSIDSAPVIPGARVLKHKGRG